MVNVDYSVSGARRNILKVNWTDTWTRVRKDGRTDSQRDYSTHPRVVQT